MTKEGEHKSDLLAELFEEAKQLRESLLQENARLKGQVAARETESFEVEKRNSPDGTGGGIQEQIKNLKAERDLYKEELEGLRKTLRKAEAKNQEFASQYASGEDHYTNLSYLYVASYRLHSTLEFKEVLTIIKEIVLNLIGSEKFGIFLKDENSNELRMIDHENLSDMKILPIAVGSGEIGQAIEKGEIYYGKKVGGSENPIACIPLKVQEEVIGLIGIYQLLQQKKGFAPLDFELFSLMADHAATAVWSSRIHAMSGRKLKTVKSWLELLKSGE